MISLIKYLGTVLSGILLGNSAVYLFNHMPGKWFLDYGEKLPGRKYGGSDKEQDAGSGMFRTDSEQNRDPESRTDMFGAAGPESLIDGRGKNSGSDTYRPQRVRSTPWKYLFSMLFIAIGLYLVNDDWTYTAAVLAACWILLELTIADIKYRVVPDQLLILLAVSAVGFIQYHTGWQDMLAGAGLGIGIIGATALLGRAMYKRDAVGGGDIKLFAVLGLMLGTRGVLAVFMLSALLSGAHMVFLLAAHKIKRKDTIPMVPYIAVSAALYLVFIWPHIDKVMSAFLTI